MPHLASHTEAFDARSACAIACDKPAVFRKTFSDDADAHAESLKEWQQSYDQLTSGRFHGELREIWLGDIQVFRETTNQAVLQRGRAWSGAGTLGVPLAMDGDGYFCNQSLGMNGILSFDQEQEFELRTSRSFDVVGIALDSRTYRSIVNPFTDASDPSSDVRLIQPQVLVCNHNVKALRRLLVDIFDALDADPECLQSQQNQESFRSDLVGHLQASVEIATDVHRFVPTYSARKKIVDGARRHVLANVDQPITIEDLCCQLKVSRRTLQYCFQEVVGTNPVHYLRAMRLNGVRRELRTGTPGDLRIADAAARWGFWHLSHFSRDYRSMFGELPSDTLRRH